jgi:hypothetical protein
MNTSLECGGYRRFLFFFCFFSFAFYLFCSFLFTFFRLALAVFSLFPRCRTRWPSYRLVRLAGEFGMGVHAGTSSYGDFQQVNATAEHDEPNQNQGPR